MVHFKYSLIFSALFSITLSGCGSSDSSNASPTTSTSNLTYDITAERGPLLYSHVLDANNLKGQAVQDDEGRKTNIYRFTLSPAYPIKAMGGYIDVDGSGDLSAGDLELGNMQLTLNAGHALTIASSLASNPSNLPILIELGFTETQLLENTPSEDKMIAALSDEVFLYCKTNQILDLANLDITPLKDTIATRISDYQASELTALQLEQEIIETLELDGAVTTIDEATAEALLLAEDPMAITQESFDEVDVTPEFQSLITFSWDEEKMAKDLYQNLYDNLLAQGIEIKPLKNVSLNSESKHQATMETFAQSYDLDMVSFAASDQSQETFGFDADAIDSDSLPSAQFLLPEVQTMYDDLWQHFTDNNSSAIAALEAACMVEVIDVNDLNASIDEAKTLGAFDLVAALESLRSGSYNHYWAFNNALIKQGVTEGCATLGADYDQDYPQILKGNGH